jgi:hypothetical protein
VQNIFRTHRAVNVLGPAGRLRRDKRPRRRPAPQANIHAAKPPRLADDVEFRPIAANQFQLAQQRGQFVRGGFPYQPYRMSNDPRRPLVAVVGLQIAEQPISQRFRFTDVDHFAVGVEHPIHARLRRAKMPHRAACIAQRRADRQLAHRRANARPEPAPAESAELVRLRPQHPHALHWRHRLPFSNSVFELLNRG